MHPLYLDPAEMQPSDLTPPNSTALQNRWHLLLLRGLHWREPLSLWSLSQNLSALPLGKATLRLSNFHSGSTTLGQMLPSFSPRNRYRGVRGARRQQLHGEQESWLFIDV